MKLVLVLAMVVFASSANAILTDFNSNSYDNQGSVVHQDKVFIAVNAPASGLTNGQLVITDKTADDGIRVALAGTTQTVRPLCVVAETIAAYKTGKCQVYGIHDAVLLDAAVVATVGNSGYVSAVVSGYVAPIAAPGATNFPVGEFMDTVAASGTAQMFLHLL